MSPVNVEVAFAVLVIAPVNEPVENEPAPAVNAFAPMLMAPNEPPMEPVARTPTDVREEFTTSVPSVSLSKTDAPFMVNAPPVASSIFFAEVIPPPNVEVAVLKRWVVPEPIW